MFKVGDRISCELFTGIIVDFEEPTKEGTDVNVQRDDYSPGELWCSFLKNGILYIEKGDKRRIRKLSFKEVIKNMLKKTSGGEK